MGMNAGMGSSTLMNQGTQNQQQTPTETPMDKLKKLKEMFEMELITEEEFATKKKEILDKL